MRHRSAATVVATVLACACALVLAGAGTASARTAWLCRPGVEDSPCTTSTAATVRDRFGTLTPEAAAGRSQGVDCFYVYPTITDASTLNAPAVATPAIRSIVSLQVSRFSSTCRIFTPLYPQLTLGTRKLPVAQQRPAVAKAYAAVLAAWRDYLAHDNEGRGVILIGHSQGAGMLRRLITRTIDPSSKARRRLVAAYLLGADVTVRRGSDRGGDFQHVPACRSGAQLRCVVAWSSFTHVPPNPSMFARLPSPVRAVFGGANTAAGMHVLCTDPARLAGTPGRLDAYFPVTDGPPPWIHYPGLYTGGCRSQGGATWLQVTPSKADVEPRPTVDEPLGPTWGNHLFDVNVAYGQLVRIATRQARAYRKAAGR